MKVRLVQSVIPQYREPFFRRLAARPGMELEVWADLGGQGSLQTACDSGAYRRVNAPCRQLGPILWQSGLMRAVDGEAQVVVIPWNARLIQLLPAIRKAHRRGVGVVLWGHGISKQEAPWRRSIRERCGRSADAVLLYTPRIAGDLIRGGFDPDRVFVAPNCIDREPIDVARANWTEDRLQSFLSSRDCISGRVVVFISRLEPSKRVEVLIEAFRRVSLEHPDLRLVIIGDGTARADLEHQTTRLGLQSRVIFEGAVYDEDQIAPWMKAAICMAYPGPIGLSLFHAFAYGVPVIIQGARSDHGPEIDALVEGTNGLRVEGYSSAALAEAIGLLVSNQALHNTLAEAAAATFSEGGDWNLEKMVEGFADAVMAAR